MDLELKGRRALVVGSSSGIGSGIVRTLAREGAAVIVHGRSRDSAEAVAAEIRRDGGDASVVLGQLDEPAEVDRIAADALSTGPIDILVNCAGAGSSTRRWFDVPLHDWQRQFQFSTFYAVQMIHALVPAMRSRGWGRVLNVSSGSSFRPTAYGPEYAAAKLGLHTIAVSLSAELADSGVTANTLTAGIVLTENTRRVMQVRGREAGFTETGDALERRVLGELWRVPLGRAGTLEELAAVASFLVSQRASYITGTAVRVDGGSSGFVN
jgi:NAD(P)-dependent dehydrogenase (short-subunit alcohol dehydrogenase family)